MISFGKIYYPTSFILKEIIFNTLKMFFLLLSGKLILLSQNWSSYLNSELEIRPSSEEHSDSVAVLPGLQI